MAMLLDVFVYPVTKLSGGRLLIVVHRKDSFGYRSRRMFKASSWFNRMQRISHSSRRCDVSNFVVPREFNG